MKIFHLRGEKFCLWFLSQPGTGFWAQIYLLQRFMQPKLAFFSKLQGLAPNLLEAFSDCNPPERLLCMFNAHCCRGLSTEMCFICHMVE